MKELLPNEQKIFIEHAKKLPINEFALLYFAMETGCRLSECLSIKVKDVKDQKSFWVKTLKRQDAHEREVPISQNLKACLEAYLKEFSKMNHPLQNPDGYLFITARLRRQMGTRNAQYIFERVAKAAGLRKLNFHALRHTFARNLIRKGIQLQIIQALLGHKHLGSTGVYVVPAREEIFQAIA